MKLGWGVFAVLMASVSCAFAHDGVVDRAGAYLAVFTSLAYYPFECVQAKNGRYEISTVVGEALLRRPYEDLEITYFAFPPLTSYNYQQQLVKAKKGTPRNDKRNS